MYFTPKVSSHVKFMTTMLMHTGPAQQDFEWGGSSVSQIFFVGGGGGGVGSGDMLSWEN